MRVSYIYGGPIPSRRAAYIQIFRTARALCERGVPVAVYAHRITTSSETDCLAFYGVDPHPLLRIRALPRGGRHKLTYLARLWRVLRDKPRKGRHVIMSRGEPGVALYRFYRWVPLPPHVRFVYEAHRPCFTRVRSRHTPHGAIARWRQDWATSRMKAAERLVVERADGVVCLTEGVREALASLFQLTAPTLILPSGTDPPPAVLPDDTMRDIDVFYAGKLATRKGVDDLVRALRFLPGVRCWMAGGSDDEVETLRAQTENEGVADRVTLLGFIAPGEVRKLYARARVGVCPLPKGVSRVSERYTSPMKILNMMALGTPVVATDLPSVRGMLDHGRTALLAPPSNPRAFATAVRKLLDDRVLASRLADAAREEVKNYIWEERARRLHDFLGAIP